MKEKNSQKETPREIKIENIFWLVMKNSNIEDVETFESRMSEILKNNLLEIKGDNDYEIAQRGNNFPLTGVGA
jgi:uncharacterized protein YutD